MPTTLREDIIVVPGEHEEVQPRVRAETEAEIIILNIYPGRTIVTATGVNMGVVPDTSGGNEFP